MRIRSAFTIIELLVVISIIAILISILLPSLSGARDRARFVKWKGYSHSLRSDPDSVLYLNFEEQTGNESLDDGTPIVWNRAAGDPFAQAKFDIEPEDYHAQMGYWDKGNVAKRPQWNFRDQRWKGKGGLEYGPIINNEHMFIPEFRALEGNQSNFNAFAEFTLLFSMNMFSGSSWNQELSVNHQHLIETINGGNGNPWGRFTFHSTTQQSIYAGTGACCGTRFNPGDPNINSQYTPLKQWHQLAYTRRFHAPGDSDCAGMYNNGKLSHREHHNEPNGDWNGFSIGRNNTNTIHGLIDELILIKRELGPGKIAEFYQVGQVRKKK